MDRARVSSVHCRRIFIACLALLGLSAGAAGTLALVLWQSERMTGADTRLLGEQASRQIAGALEARRRSVGFLRDAMDRAPRDETEARPAFAQSAVTHVSHWSGNGWIDRNKKVHWWIPPARISEPDSSLVPQIRQRIRWRDWVGLPSAFVVPAQSGRPSVYVVVEPFRARWNRPERLVAVFDLEPILRESLGPLSAQVLESNRVLYRSPQWQAPVAERHSVIEIPIRWEANRWVLQAQQITPPLIPVGWFRSLMALCLLAAGLAAGGMAWAAERLRRLATTDELTGLYNRRHFFERWEEEVERAQRYGRNLSCLLIDLNGFKRVNDLLGHNKGDQLLKETALRLQAALRQSDLLARLGGDEFVVALPETDLMQASRVAEKLRTLTIPAGILRPLSLSVGVTQMRAGDSVHDIVQRADVDLYSGKGAASNGQMVHFAG